MFMKSKPRFPNASVSKLKKLLFVATVYLVVVLVSSIFKLNVIFRRDTLKPNCSCKSCPVESEYKMSTALQTDLVADNIIRYRFINFNFRTVGVAKSSEELEHLLNIRKLILFAVHELNLPLKFTNCLRWWANPLDLISHEARKNSKRDVVHLINFFVQPGNLRFRATVRQQLAPIDVNDTELQIIDYGFEDNLDEKSCGLNPMASRTKGICLCGKSGPEFIEYNKITWDLRTTWNFMDPELPTWPLDQSFDVKDYMNFTDYEWFVRSPGITAKEIKTRCFSREYCAPVLNMLVMVSSAPNHFDHRKVIRETYASPSNLKGKGIKVVFLTGVSADVRIKELVTWESKTFKDIIQANFVDSYHNLSISHLSMYNWAHLTCIQGVSKGITVPPFILKADDDFFLNLDLALQVAQQNNQYELIGCLYCGTNTVRNAYYMYKYYTPRYMHISNSYPGYLSGVTYLLRTDVIPRILHASKTTPMIHMDDTYVTGILPRQLKIYPKNSPLFTYGRTKPDPCLTKKMVNSYVSSFEDMYLQWKNFVQPIPENCTLGDVNIKVPELSSKNEKRCFFS